MVPLAGLATLGHIGAAMALIAGLVGSRILNRRAARSERIVDVVRLTRAAAPFDRILSIAGPLTVLTGLLAAWANDYPWLGPTTPWILATLAIIVVLVALVGLVFAPTACVSRPRSRQRCLPARSLRACEQRSNREVRSALPTGMETSPRGQSLRSWS